MNRSVLEDMTTPAVEIRPATGVGGRRRSIVVEDVLDLLPKLERLVQELRNEAEGRRAQETVGDGRSARICVICEAVADHYGVHLSNLLGASRAPEFAWPRQVAYALARELTEASYNQLGRFFDRDHSSILHGVRVVFGRANALPRVKVEIAPVRAEAVRRLAQYDAEHRS